VDDLLYQFVGMVTIRWRWLNMDSRVVWWTHRRLMERTAVEYVVEK